MPIIRVINLTKRFKKVTAVDNLSLEIEEGEIFGLLGPNGADLIRAYLLGSPPFTTDLLQNLLIFSTIFMVSGATAYIKIMEHD